MKASVFERFLAKVQFPEVDGCWVWMGSKSSDGNGRLWDGKRVRQAHQLSWEWASGKPLGPSVKIVAHLCGNSSCVRPDHLIAKDAGEPTSIPEIVVLPDNLAWAAGLFEGEGWIRVKPAHVELGLKMTDEDVVRRFAEVLGIGYVDGPIQPSGNRKLIWTWHLAQGEFVRVFLEAIEPWMGKRRTAKIKEAYIALGKRTRIYPATCGTIGGYDRHRDLGEETCGPCRDAVNEKNRKNRRRRLAQ